MGDALGGPYEGRKPPVRISHDSQWRLSDDTQLTLATCEAIIASGGHLDPEVVASRFASWHRQRRVTGMGASTYKALTELAAGGHWALSGAKGERAAGNGAAMRIAPAAFLLDPSVECDRRMIRDLCRITHRHEEAYVGALAVVVALRAVIEHTWKGGDDLLEIVISALPDSKIRDRMKELGRYGVNRPLEEIAILFGTSGYVVESVPLALYGAQQIGRLGFKGVLKELISAGGDTDTNASIAGQVSGAYLGKGALPSEMLEKLPENNLVKLIAGKFAGQLV